jgi:hypothetical protein
MNASRLPVGNSCGNIKSGMKNMVFQKSQSILELSSPRPGPIVRISPNEVHIQDPTFYETLYAQSRHSNKLKHLEHRFNNPLSSFATAEHNVHRVRRGALNPFFSKRKITQYSPNIQNHMNRLCKRVISEYLANDSILNLNNMWGAFTSDIVVGYCLENSYDFIMKPDFRAEFSDAM